MKRVPPLYAGGLAVAIALVVAASWCGRSRAPVVESAEQGTVAVRITRHDAVGMPSRTAAVRDPGRVHSIVVALGVDAYVPVTCPPDYAAAELGLVLTGRDVYAKRNVYVWDLFVDAGADSPTSDGVTHAVVVSSSGCRGGTVVDAAALRHEILMSDAGP